MTAYFLAAGFGTRMQPRTLEIPKSLVRVSGHPILDYLLDELTSWDGLDAVHVAVNHRDASAFREWAGRHRSALETAGIRLHVHDDGVETPDDQLGVVGDLAFLLEETGVPDDGALVSGGDSLYRFPLAPILNRYDGTSNEVLALYEPDPERRQKSSLLHLEDSVVREIVDDPAGGDTPWICPSWALLTAEALRTVPPYLERGEPDDSLGAFLNHVARQQILHAVHLPERRDLRLHCNTIDDLERAQRLFHAEPRHVVDAERIRQCLRVA